MDPMGCPCLESPRKLWGEDQAPAAELAPWFRADSGFEEKELPDGPRDSLPGDSSRPWQGKSMGQTAGLPAGWNSKLQKELGFPGDISG